ncbi:MAG: Asp-tRNA(Asn)/Glu-tRNA(Gln) amidotransferase subunit GatA [Deltaproteobacteria bacterium]|nr:Asp-tRNA(Asn)/Glu-tRNA(Gln) amidotransferase subunit GatA [Deltaproteobacteria bacterium]
MSPLTLIESILQRIDSLEPSIKAWVTIDRKAVLNEARRHQEEIVRGKNRGILRGIPIGVKDIFYTSGVKTTAGSKIFENFIPDHDATAVARLKKAGAIVLGKTASTEFAFADPAPTRNPWNLEHTPGGSSSGSAAAVATRMCPAALGSQTGGSILRPAAYCGVVGLKPTYGRISRYGVFPLSWTLDHVGFLTRCVEDAAIILGVLAGRDPKDPTASQEAVPDYSHFLKSSRKAPRIGLVRAFYREKSEEQIWKHTEETLSKLEKAGAQMEEVKMPSSFSFVQDAHRIIMRVEGAAFHEKLFEQHQAQYRPKIRELIEIGLLIPSADYLRAQKIKRQFRGQMDEVMRHFDCLLTPATSSPAPQGLASTGDPWFQIPWSLSGLPTIGLPSGLNPEGLPLGIQLVGAAFAEGKLFAAARWCEKVLGVSLSPSIG